MLPVLDPGSLSWPDAIEALRSALHAGLDPEREPDRIASPFGSGQLLTMPSTAGRWAGVKLVSIAADRPGRTEPRIHGLYVLFDAETLAPVATLDGAVLTTLRTPAVSALGVELVAPADVSELLVFGNGPQAAGHVQALRAIRPIERVGVVGRNPDRTAAFVDRLRAEGVEATVAKPAEVGSYGLIACCTTAREPLFDGRSVADGTVVVACGSHEPQAREVDSETVRRCGGAVVESLGVARSEAGDVIQAVSDGAVDWSDLAGLAGLVRGEVRSRPRLVKTVGMGWQDLVIAAAIADRWDNRP